MSLTVTSLTPLQRMQVAGKICRVWRQVGIRAGIDTYLIVGKLLDPIPYNCAVAMIETMAEAETPLADLSLAIIRAGIRVVVKELDFLPTPSS